MTHETPADLDYLFERGLVDPLDYVDFWQNYWYLEQQFAEDRQEYIDRFLGQEELMGYEWR